MLKQILKKHQDYLPNYIETEIVKANAKIKRNIKAIEKILNISCEDCWFSTTIQRHLNNMKGE